MCKYACYIVWGILLTRLLDTTCSSVHLQNVTCPHTLMTQCASLFSFPCGIVCPCPHSPVLGCSVKRMLTHALCMPWICFCTMGVPKQSLRRHVHVICELPQLAAMPRKDCIQVCCYVCTSHMRGFILAHMRARIVSLSHLANSGAHATPCT